MTTSTSIPAFISEHASWDMWFMCLPPWDKRTVLKHECEWFYDYLEGRASFKDLHVLIRRDQGIPEVEQDPDQI